MTVISFAACSGAPGVTTMAVATAAALRDDVAEVVLLEAGTSGGVIGGQYELPLEPGLTSLALALGTDRPNILRHAQELPGGLPVIPAPPSGLKTTKLLEARAAILADYLRTESSVTVVDCGRISVGSPVVPVLFASSLVAMVVTPTRENFRLAATALAELQEMTEGAIPAGWVIVGSCPWSHQEIAAQYGLPVLAAVPDDEAGAEAVAGLRRFRRQSPLARAARTFADDVAKHLRVTSQESPLGYMAPPPPGAEPPTPIEEIEQISASDEEIERDDGPVEGANDLDDDGSADVGAAAAVAAAADSDTDNDAESDSDPDQVDQREGDPVQSGTSPAAPTRTDGGRFSPRMEAPIR